MEGTCGNFGVADFATSYVERANGTIEQPGVLLDLSALAPANLDAGGHFVVECYDRDGGLRWEDVAENGIVNSTLNDILNVYWRSTAQTPNWYIGLVDNAGFTGFAASDAMASHPGWVENTSYSNATRVQWSPSAASNQGVTNPTSSDFSMNPSSPATIKGLFLCSDNAKGGTAGNLCSTAAFSGGNQTVNSGDTLKVTYTISASST